MQTSCFCKIRDSDSDLFDTLLRGVKAGFFLKIYINIKHNISHVSVDFALIYFSNFTNKFLLTRININVCFLHLSYN